MLTLATVALLSLGSAPHLLDESDTWVSAAQLRTDLAALRQLRPSLAPGITLIAVGGGFAGVGALYLGVGLAAATVPLWAFGVVGLGLGLPIALVGIWLLITRIPERERVDAESNRLKQLLEQRVKEERSTGLLSATPTFTLARF